MHLKINTPVATSIYSATKIYHSIIHRRSQIVYMLLGARTFTSLVTPWFVVYSTNDAAAF